MSAGRGYVGNEPAQAPIDTAQLGSNVVTSAKLGYVMPRSYGRNFAGYNNSNSQWTFTADELVLHDPSGYPMLLASVSKVTDITVSGAGGLDTGSEASNTWYYVWIIAKADGTVSSIFSTSSSAPTMPSGYTFKALVSAVRNNGSSNILSCYQRGRHIRFIYGPDQVVVNAGTATTETAVTITSFVPSIASTFTLYATVTSGSVSVSGVDTLSLKFVASNAAVQAPVQSISGGGQSNTIDTEFPNNSQTLYYQLTKNSTSSLTADIYISGFTMPIGGE